MEYSEKQLHIIESAERLFAENGFHGSSIRDIAKDADVNIAMISYYFGSKEKLLEALFAVRTEEIKIKLETLLNDNTLTPLEKTYRLIDNYIDKIMNQQCFHKIMMREQMANREGNMQVSTLIRETKLKNRALIMEIIKQGQKLGHFKKNVDIQLLLLTLMGTVNQLLSSQDFYKETNNLQDMPDDEFRKHIRKKLSHHLKLVFKALLITNEE